MDSPIGVTFASLPVLGARAAPGIARDAADLGYRSFWTAETVGDEAFALLGAVGAAVPDLTLGTGVLALQLRTPPLAAMGAATLQALAPEREVLLGVGISSPVVTERWHGAGYGDRPLARVREYLTLVRECLSGEAVTFQGDFYDVRRFRLGVRLGDRRPRIVLGALNPGMLRLAGELADGVLLNYLPAALVPWSVDQVRGAETEPGSTEIYAYVHAGVCDREDAVESARRDLFSYAVVDAYARSFERAGFADAIAEIRSRHADGDRPGAVAAVPDEMVDAIDIVGDAEHVHGAVRAYAEAGVDHPVLMPLPWGEDRAGVVAATMRAAIGRG